jgi:hypothetical protein
MIAPEIVILVAIFGTGAIGTAVGWLFRNNQVAQLVLLDVADANKRVQEIAQEGVDIHIPRADLFLFYTHKLDAFLTEQGIDGNAKRFALAKLAADVSEAARHIREAAVKGLPVLPVVEVPVVTAPVLPPRPVLVVPPAVPRPPTVIE